MTNNNKTFMVPPAVLDIGNNVLSASNETVKNNYLSRIAAIREYCESILKSSEQKTNFKRR